MKTIENIVLTVAFIIFCILISPALAFAALVISFITVWYWVMNLSIMAYDNIRQINLTKIELKIWIFHCHQYYWWKFMWGTGQYFGMIQNDKTAATKWGIYILGFEIGSRDPNSRFGAWLKKKGLYPW